MAEANLTPAAATGSIPAATSGATTAPVAPAAPKAVRTPAEPGKPDKGGFIWGTGRRKTAVARVRIKPGTGKFLVNNREAKVFFTEIRDQMSVLNPLKVTSTTDKVDVFVNVKGGGFTGQAGAVVLGLARALMSYDPSLEPILRDNDLLTRDARKVERKKYGKAGARRRFQFSKR